MAIQSALQHVETWQEEMSLLASVIEDRDGPLEILEAGCGREWLLDLKGVDYRVTGIDLDAHALRSRIEIRGDPDEAIVGDLTVTGAIPVGWYDVVYCSFVLEHIRDAEGALVNMFDGLKPGGLLVLRIPDRDAVYGWTASRAPIRPYVANYKYFPGISDAGKPGHAPYSTFHEPVVSRDDIRDFCGRHGYEILKEWGHTHYLQGPGAHVRLTRAYAKALSGASRGAPSPT